MMLQEKIATWLFHSRRAKPIARRYFVTNGFDGALTILGILVGIAVSGDASVPIAITACVSAAIALCVSGLSSAYLSESAERKKELQNLEDALITDLSESEHGKAMRIVPIMVALVNGLSPLIFALVIIFPLWLFQKGVQFSFSPFVLSIVLAMTLIFGLGVVLGRLSQEFWLWTGLRTLAVGMLTAGIVFFLAG